MCGRCMQYAVLRYEVTALGLHRNYIKHGQEQIMLVFGHGPSDDPTHLRIRGEGAQKPSTAP